MLQELFDGCLQLDNSEQTAVFFDQLRQIPACKGVMLFADENDKPIKLQIAADLRRCCREKLITPHKEPGRKADLAPVTDKIYYTCCYNDFRAMLYYYLTARTIYPAEYKELISLPKQTYTSVDLSFKLPYFCTTASPLENNTTLKFGVFPSRRTANHFAETLNDVFSLCRRPDLIRTDDQQTCPYLQMQTCPAPCIGKISRDEYGRSLEIAVAAASGFPAQALDDLRAEMMERSRQMEFEKANECKKRIARLESLDRPEYKWVARITDLAVLHFDRSKKIKQQDRRSKLQTYSAFLITADRTTEFEDFTLSDISPALANLANEKARQAPIEDIEQANNRLAILSYFLFRSTASGLWLDLKSNIPTTKQLKHMIVNHFEQSKNK